MLEPLFVVHERRLLFDLVRRRRSPVRLPNAKEQVLALAPRRRRGDLDHVPQDRRPQRHGHHQHAVDPGRPRGLGPPAPILSLLVPEGPDVLAHEVLVGAGRRRQRLPRQMLLEGLAPRPRGFFPALFSTLLARVALPHKAVGDEPAPPARSLSRRAERVHQQIVGKLRQESRAGEVGARPRPQAPVRSFLLDPAPSPPPERVPSKVEPVQGRVQQGREPRRGDLRPKEARDHHEGLEGERQQKEPVEGEELEERGDLETLAGAPEEARRGERGDRDGDASTDGDALDQKRCEPVGRVGAARRARRLARARGDVPHQRRGDLLDPGHEEILEHEELEVAVVRVGGRPLAAGRSAADGRRRARRARDGALLLFISFLDVVQEPKDADAEERHADLLDQRAERALLHRPRLAREERGAFHERRRLGGVLRRDAAAVHGHRLREREELAPPDARRHAYLDAVRAGHDRARRARRHDPGDRLLRPVLRGVDGRGRPLDQAEAAGARAAAEATPDVAAAAIVEAAAEAAAEAGRHLLQSLPRERRGDGQLCQKRGDGPLLPERRDAGRELIQARRDVASEKRCDAGRELLQARHDVAPEPGAPLAELLVARARLARLTEQQPTELQAREKQRDRARDQLEDPAAAADEDAPAGNGPVLCLRDDPVPAPLQPRVAAARRLRDAAREDDAKDPDADEGHEGQALAPRDPDGAEEVDAGRRGEAADVRDLVAAAPRGPRLHRPPEPRERRGVVAQLRAGLAADVAAAAVELARRGPRARVRRRGRRRGVEPGEFARRARRGPEVLPRVVPLGPPAGVVVGLVQPRLVPALPRAELRVEEVAVLGDHAAGLDALALAPAPVPRRGRPRLCMTEVGAPPVARAGDLVAERRPEPRDEVPPAPRVLADVVERAGRRVAPQVVAGVGLSPKVAGAGADEFPVGGEDARR
mmetsp:Transcript_6637/g.19972  ORF Transcript_6637/g.19972 Transcript_6637/m.19972 type:complete len:937 (+) Transcript_6637:730-3540(+)